MSTATTDHDFDLQSLDHCPFMPVFGAPEIMFERGQGTELWDMRRQALSRLPRRHRRRLARSRQPGGRRRDRAPGARLLHVSNFFTNPVAAKAATMVNEQLVRRTGRQGQIFFTNSGAEAIECAIKLARKYGGRGRHAVVSALGSFHGRTLAALAATGQPTKHEPFQPMPEGFRHVAWGDLDAMRAAVDAIGRGGADRAGAGRGRRQPRHRRVPAGDPRRSATSVGALMMVDEIQTGFGRTGRVVRLRARRRRARRRDAGQGDGQRHAGRRLLGAHARSPRCSSRATTAARTAARRSPPRPSNAVIAEMRRIDAPALADAQGRPARRRPRARSPGVVEVRGQGLLLARRARRRRRRARPSTGGSLERGLVTNAVTPTALRFAPPLTVTDAEIDEAVDMVAEVAGDA